MQRHWVRRLSPRVLVVALGSMAMVVTAVAVSQADQRSGRAVSVAMLSGGEASPLPAADPATASPEAVPLTAASPPPAEPSTTTTSASGTTARSARTTARAVTVTAIAPGSYRLEADWPSRIGGCGPVEVTVEYGRFTSTEVSCDTGIRSGGTEKPPPARPPREVSS